jgi:S1-C subfamily serine protease
MNKRIFILIFYIILPLTSFGQEEKIYYNSEWKVCEKSEAEYFRIITFDKNKNPKGKVKDFYLNGKLQWEGYLSFMDKYDNSLDITEGTCTFYSKEGKKERTDYYEKNKTIKPSLFYFYYPNGNLQSKISKELESGFKDGKSIWYHNNGEIKSIGFYSKGKANGLFTWFKEDGEINSINVYKDDIPIDKFWINFDSYKKKFFKTFSDNFDNTENPNGWHIGKDNFGRESKYSNGSLKYKYIKDGGNRNSIELNLINNRDYTINIDLKRISGPKGKPFGLIWGFKNWENYNYFYISSFGGYKIGAEVDGFEITDGWQSESSNVNKNSSNELRVKKIDNKTYFAINGKLVDSKESFSLYGSEIGFMVYGNGNTILMENIEIKQEFTKEDLKNLLSEHSIETNEDDKVINSKNNKTDWKGNGTGFFIDKKGYIATNYHVIDDANEIQIEFIRNGVKQYFPANVIKSDKQNDISIIKIISSDFKPFSKLPFKFKTNISDVGSNVFALGYPLLNLMGNEIKFTDGKISSKTGIRGDITSYQISVPIQPGNSGGPLFDFDGNLIGITSSGINRKLDITENVNYAIKSSYLKNLIDVLDYKLSLPNDESISNTTLTEKIKIITDYVVLIKIK